MGWLNDQLARALAPRRIRRLKANRRPAIRLSCEALEDRCLLSGSTPFTADGRPWEILASGPSVIEAENFDYGGEGVAYHSNYTKDPGGAYRPNEGMGVEGPFASTGNTYDVGYFNPGNWMNYTIQVDQAGTYVLDLHASSAPPNGATAHVSFSSSGTSGEITIANTGNWGNYQDFTTTLTLAAGTQIMTVWEDTGAYNLDYISLTPQTEGNSSEKAYSPEGTNPGVGLRGAPPVLPAFGSAQIESENYDLGGQAAGASGVQSAGYYWLDQSQYPGTYPYSTTSFRPGEYVDLGNRATGLVTTNWRGGDWTQYSVLAATNVSPLNPAATQPNYQPTSPSLQYQLLVSYSNSGTQTSTFTISSTYTDPMTGVTNLVPVGTVTFAPTGSIWTYETATAQIILPGVGLNTLRFTDADPAGTSSGVDIDYFRLINSRTSGNNGAPWDISASGTTTHIAADNYDVAPDGHSFPSGTAPVVAPTGDIGGGNDVQNFSSNDSLTYTIMAELTSKYNLTLRVKNLGAMAAQLEVTFDAGASFGTLGLNNQPAAPVIFTFNVPVAAGYQTLTTATNISTVPNTTNPWVEIPWGPQKMQIRMLSGTVNFHWMELSAITAPPAAVKPDPNELGSYAAEPPNTILNTIGDLFTVVYNTDYKWINPPADATVPTNDWWTNLLISQFAGDMYAFPQKLNDSAAGVAVSSYSGVGTDGDGGAIQGIGQESLVVGGAGTTFGQDALLDYGDWTIHYRMGGAADSSMDVTSGRGLPYTWFEFNGLTPTLTMHAGNDASQAPFTAFDANGNPLGTTFATDHFLINTGGQSLGVFAPTGTTFTLSGNTWRVNFAPGAKQYLVVSVLPDSSAATLNLFYQYAYAIPRQVGGTMSSKYTWDPYNAASGQITTHWNLNTVLLDPNAPAASQAAQGNLATLQGWLPIDYDNGASGLNLLTGAGGQFLQFPSLNGNIRVAAGTSFAVSQQTDGINFALALPQVIGAPTYTYDPTNPTASTVSTDFDPQQMRTFLQTYIQQHIDTAASAAAGQTLLVYGNDTYWGGKPLQEYAEYALIARQMGDTADFNIFLNSLRRAMTDWLTYTPGTDTTSHFFAYYPGSHALIGFNPGYGAEDFTDNHFHYGYTTVASGVLAMLDPTWGAEYGAMAKMIAMQYANWLHPGDTPDLTDPNAISLPFLRTFEPWIGHSYAGGTSSGAGNNQESTSEAIQSWLGLVLLGQALNDPGMTSAGIMGYTMESKAVQEQWFNNAAGSTNSDGTAFPSTFTSAQGIPHSNVGINFDGAKVYATYFGTSPEFILGIQSLPIWPSLDFLGRNKAVAAAAIQNVLAQRNVYYNQAATNPNYNPASPGTYNTFASFDDLGGFGGADWLNITLGFQAEYDPQATANEYARDIAQQGGAASQGTTGLYYWQDHSYQTYGNRDWNYHLSVPLGGVYSHGSDGTTMANTRTYMAYNAGTTPETVQVLDSNNNVVDSFLAQPGFNVVTRSATGGHALPIITQSAAASPAAVTGTSTQLSVLGTDEQQNEGNLTYTWSLASGPSGAQTTFSANGTNAAKSTTVTFSASGTYTFLVTVRDVNGLSATSTVVVNVVPTLSTIVLTPNTANVFTNGVEQFSVSGTDQFGATLANPAVSWSVSGPGTIDNTGLYRAPGSTGSAVVTATSGTASLSATVNVLNQLPAPSGLSAAVANNYTEVDLSWNAPSGSVTGYYVYRATSPGGESTTPLNSTPISGTSFIDTTVAPQTSYFYTVKAVNVGGASAASNEATGTSAPDLAFNAAATASSVENGGTGPANAVDGNSGTRWSSQFSDPQWIAVDLGSTFTITEVKLNWETAAGKDYQIQVSSDATNWTNLLPSITGNTTSGWHDYPGLTGSGQYVRVYGTARDTQYGYSLFDFNVYGTAVPSAPAALSATVVYAYEVDLSWAAPSGSVTGYNVYRGTSAGGESATPLNATPITGTNFQDTTVSPGNSYYYTVVAVNAAGSSGPSNEATATTPTLVSADLALGKQAYASSIQCDAFPASNAVDGNSGSRWSSQFSDPQWIYVDLGATYNISEVTLNWENAAGKDYQIQVSSDATNWTTIKSVTGNTTSGVHDYTGLSGIGRYVRMDGSARDTQYGYSLYDFNVYGTGTTAGVTPLSQAGWTASASSTAGGDSAANPIDGKPGTRWSSGTAQTAGQWFQLDLGSAQTFDRITLDPGRSVHDFARGYEVLVSNNGTDWSSQTAIASGAGSSSLEDIQLAGPVTARYVRIVQTGSSSYWWSIAELNLYV
jgi:endoglucanase Acf2/fibronectin type 3 domain-containing protein